MALSLEIVARTLFDTDVTPDVRAINDEVNTIMGLYNFIVAFPRSSPSSTSLSPASSNSANPKPASTL